jgi:hypothetical protein
MESVYKKNTDRLVFNTALSANEVFDYYATPYEDEFNEIFEFYFETLRIENEHFNFSPYFLFFRNNVSINAIAGKDNGYYFIGLNSGLIINLIVHIKNMQFNIKKNSIPQNFINQLNTGLNNLLYQYALHFTLYHELGHLIQFSCDALDECDISNNNQEVMDSAFSLNKHYLELDADTYSSLYLANHTLDYAQRTFENISSQKYILMTKICLTSIILYIQSFFNINQPFYLRSNSHPHPVIRIINASLAVINYINDFLVSKGFAPIVDAFEIIFDSIKISSQMPINRFNPNTYQQIANGNRIEILKYIEEITTEDNKCSAVNRRNSTL